MKRTLSRRSLIKAAPIALGLPWLEYFSPRRAAASRRRVPGYTQDGFKQRLVVVFSGLGTLRSEWYNGNAGGYTFDGKILNPLASKRDRMTIVRGLTHSSNGGTHEAVELAALTAQPYIGDRKTTKNAAGLSVDQLIANEIGADTLRKSIHMSMQGKDQYNPLSHAGRESPIFPLKNPYTAFDQYFDGVAPDSGGSGPLPPADNYAKALRARRRQVLDGVNAQYKSLQDRIGAADRARLQQHVAGLDELIARLDKLDDDGAADPEGAADCALPVLGDHRLLPARGSSQDNFQEEHRLGSETYDRMDAIARTYFDIVARAFSCDVTRIAVLDHAHYHSHGGTSHKVDTKDRSQNPGGYDEIFEAGRRAAANINYLVDALSAIPEGSGSVMDNTLIYWLYSHSDGSLHELTDCIDVLIGNAGGAFETGRLVQLASGDGRPHNELLTSIANVYGLSAEGFGKQEWRGRGRLPELGVSV